MARPTAIEALGLPTGFKLYSPYPFAGLNQQSARGSIDDKEFFWIENYIRIGPGTLRTVWDAATATYTATGGRRIVFGFSYNIDQQNFIALFFNDGTALQLNTDTDTQVTISSQVGTFFVPGGSKPACSQSGSKYLLISNNNTRNDYWIWDGEILYTAGTLGPVVTITNAGTGYSSVPTVTLVGGSGSGAVLQAAIANGSVVAVDILNPGTGYQPGEVVQVFFSGGGSASSAQLAAVLSGGIVSGVDVSDGGTGYTSTPTVTIDPPSSGVQATATAIVSGGVVTAIQMTNVGSNYTSTPNVTITGGGGSGATAVAVLSAGSLSAVTVINGGSGFSQAPVLTVVGGGGTGATAVANMSGDAIASVTVTNGGSGYTSSPAIEVQAGINNAAAAVVELMPYGVSGAAIETFQQRVWLDFPHQEGLIVNSDVFLVSAPESLTDFATTDGGLLYENRDRFLRQQYTAVRQSGSYLYQFGDSSVNVVSNVNTSGDPPLTTFNYQNVDPQVGTSWRDSLQDYGNDMLFANPLGVYGLFGGSVRKLSEKLDKLFASAVFPPQGTSITPSGAVASIHNVKTYLLLLSLTDPITNTQRNIMLGYDQRDWFVVSQSPNLNFIFTQEVSSNLFAWGTDGTSLYKLMQTPSTDTRKILSTKSYGMADLFITKQTYAYYMKSTDFSGDGMSFTATMDTDHGSYPMTHQPVFPSAGPSDTIFAAAPGDFVAQEFGWTLITNGADHTVENMLLGYVQSGSIFGVNPPPE